jgi:DNA-binding transcriptional regulator YiaG
VIGASGVRTIRERTKLSQSEFAHLIGVSLKTLQNWEQDRRRPAGPAAALLKIIAHEQGDQCWSAGFVGGDAILNSAS